MNAQIAEIAIQEMPAAIALIRAAFAKRNPDLPELTDEDAVLGLRQACVSTIAKDDQWLAHHPPAVGDDT